MPSAARPTPVDAAIAAVAIVAALVELPLTGVSPTPGQTAAGVLLPTAPLAWRSVAPTASAAVATAGLLVAVLLGFPAADVAVPSLAPLIAVYSIGLHARPRAVLVGGILALALFAVAAGTADPDDPQILAVAASGVLLALAVGGAVRLMGFESERLHDRAARLEAERDEQARAAVSEERARIARELHDVIGHSISVMGVQAGAVRRLLRPEQEQEREVLLAVERSGRDAVAEMRRLLGFLREDDAAPGVAAAPTLERVGDLVAAMRRAGLDVDLHVEGELDDLPPGRALAAFRILQEALTNSLKHAPGAHVRAFVRRAPDGLVIEVADDGAGAGGTAASGRGGGHGLVGMRERAAMYEGTLEAGPREGGGFRTAARLPLGGA